MRVHRFAPVLATAALALGLGACGDDDDNGGDAPAPGPAATAETQPQTTETTETATTEAGGGETAAAGRQVFSERCASCHTLSDADATGSVGPNLDETTLDAAAIEQQVRQGGNGMPAFEGSLSDQEIQAVSQYVADVKGG